MTESDVVFAIFAIEIAILVCAVSYIAISYIEPMADALEQVLVTVVDVLRSLASRARSSGSEGRNDG